MSALLVLLDTTEQALAREIHSRENRITLMRAELDAVRRARIAAARPITYSAAPPWGY